MRSKTAENDIDSLPSGARDGSLVFEGAREDAIEESEDAEFSF